MELDHERSEIKRTVAAYEHSYVPRSDLGSSYVPATHQQYNPPVVVLDPYPRPATAIVDPHSHSFDETMFGFA